MSNSPPSHSIGAAFAAAIVTALAQLGLASGLAITLWNDDGPSEWASQLTWAAWLATVSAVVGGLVAGKTASETGSRVTGVLAAGIGAFVVAPLAALPAMRFTGEAMATAPFAATGIGALVGVIVAGFALAWRSVWVNVCSGIGLAWALAIGSALLPLGREPDTVDLGVWGRWGPEWVAVPLWAGALAIGMISAWALVDGTTANHRATAMSGAVAPLLVSASYAASWQPDVGVDVRWIDLAVGGGAALSGLMGSLLVTAWRRAPIPAADHHAPVASASVPVASPADATVTVPAQAERTQHIPAAPQPYEQPGYDPYDSAALGEFAPPQPEPEPEAKPKSKSKSRKSKAAESTPPAEPGADATESWVSDLREDTPSAGLGLDPDTIDTSASEPKKKRRFGRKKKNDDTEE